LLNDIGMSKTYLLENLIETSKYGHMRLVQELSLRKQLRKATISHDVLDVQSELGYDLYRFVGMRCIKYESGFVFEIFSNDDVTRKDTSWKS